MKLALYIFNIYLTISCARLNNQAIDDIQPQLITVFTVLLQNIKLLLQLIEFTLFKKIKLPDLQINIIIYMLNGCFYAKYYQRASDNMTICCDFSIITFHR